MRLLPTKRSVFCGERQKRRQPSTCSVRRFGSPWMSQTSGCIPLGRRETMALKNQSVVDKWNTLVLNGAGRATHVLQTIDKKIQEANIPGIRKSMQEVSQGGLFAAK